MSNSGFGELAGFTPAPDFQKLFKEPTIKYSYPDGVFECCDSDGNLTKTVHLREALQIGAMLGRLLCDNSFIMECNLRHVLKPAFKKHTEDGHRDYEAIRQVIEDNRKPGYKKRETE